MRKENDLRKPVRPRTKFSSNQIRRRVTPTNPQWALVVDNSPLSQREEAWVSAQWEYYLSILITLWYNQSVHYEQMRRKHYGFQKLTCMVLERLDQYNVWTLEETTSRHVQRGVDSNELRTSFIWSRLYSVSRLKIHKLCDITLYVCPVNKFWCDLFLAHSDVNNFCLLLNSTGFDQFFRLSTHETNQEIKSKAATKRGINFTPLKY